MLHVQTVNHISTHILRCVHFCWVPKHSHYRGQDVQPTITLFMSEFLMNDQKKKK